MTAGELDFFINYILPKIAKEGERRVALAVPDHLEGSHQIPRDQAFEVVDRLMELRLAENGKYKGDMVLTKFGRDVLRDGGWNAYIQRENVRRQRARALEQAELDAENDRRRVENERAEETVRIARRTRRDTNLTMWATWIASGVAAISLYLSINSNSETKAMQKEIDSLKVLIEQLDSLSKKQPPSREQKPILLDSLPKGKKI